MAAVSTAVIVGGGIGGLTLALALQRIGVEARIVEKGTRADRLGTGICLLGNALHALDRIGMADTCIAAGYACDSVTTCDHTGAVLSEMHPPRTFRPDAPPSIGIMRPVLADLMETAATAAGATISFATTVETLDQHDDHVALTLSTGERIETDLVVGADGAYSPMRRRLFGDAHVPRHCGQSAIRYTTERPKNLHGFKMYRTPTGRLIGAFPLSEEWCYLFMLESGPRRARLTTEETAALWREWSAEFTAPELVRARDMVDRSPSISYRPFDVLAMPLPWHQGRVTLIGDAVHSLSPQLTSGGGMAIEDAVILAEELDRAADVAAALTSFGERRFARTSRIFDISFEICGYEQSHSLDNAERSVRKLGEGYAVLAEAF